MEKYIMQLSYWLGVIFLAVAVVARGLNMLGVISADVLTRGNPISFRSLVDGAILFLLTSIATTGYLWFKKKDA